MENTKDLLMKHVPHILMRESHNAPISAISNPFYNIITVNNIYV